VIKLDYTPNYSVKVPFPTEIVVKKISDERGVDPTLIAQKGIAQKTSGRYLSEQEIGDFLSDGIKATLSQLGYTIVRDGGNFTLSGQLMKFDSHGIMGFWSGALEASIQANMKLSDDKSNTIVWHEVVSGNGRLESLQMDGDDNRKEVTEKAVVNFMKRLVESESLKNVLESRQTGTTARGTNQSAAVEKPEKTP
jgi:hypothetical protein